MGEDYGLSLNDLCKLMEQNGIDGINEINKLGGIEEICKKLGTSPKQGLVNSVEYRRTHFGSNTTTTSIKPKASFCQSLWNAVCDKILIILIVECIFVIYVILFLMCVVIVVLVTALIDYFNERHFQSFLDDGTVKHSVVVIRNAVAIQIPVEELVVGDVCVINTDDSVPADGILVDSNDLKIDEASLTGNSSYIEKCADRDLMVLSGTKVIEGSGTMVVTAVGVNTRKGNIFSLLEIKQQKQNSDHSNLGLQSIIFDNQKSILQQKVRRLFFQIIYVSLVIAALLVIILTCQHAFNIFIIEDRMPDVLKCLEICILFIINATAEGIPLTVVLTLAYSIKRMIKDNILVRRLYDSETMGNVTSICFDKTGTLTSRGMEVVQCYICEKTWNSTQNISESLPNHIARLVAENISVNSSSKSTLIYREERVFHIGNDTECALLDFVPKLGLNFQMIRDSFLPEQYVRVFGFNSDRKLMSTVIRTADGGYRLFVKGASELVLFKCKFIVGQDGKFTEMSYDLREKLLDDVIKPMAKTGQRTITLAYRDFITKNESLNEEPDWNDETNIVSNLTCLCVFGIKHPIRSDVHDTIKNLHVSGITVRMVTGDDIDTARSIASKCGIFVTSQEDVILDGTEFNRRIRDSNGCIQQHLFDEVFPTLRVLARASPMDKYILVKGIIESNINKHREVVAMVGDGDGDALALKKADIGFSMNEFSTVAAKSSSNIILTDDKLSGILNAVLWGRNAYDSIGKFIQFILTVKVVFVVTISIDTLAVTGQLFDLLHLFFINMFLDIMALLQAFLTYNPTNDLLLTQPHGRTDHLISRTMFKNIVGQSIYHLVVIFSIKFIGLMNARARYYQYSRQYSVVAYNAFVLMILFNVFNCRKIRGERNVFGGIQKNLILCLIWIFALVFHVLVIQMFMSLLDESWPDDSKRSPQWLWCLLFGIGTLIWQQLLSSFCNETNPQSIGSTV